MKKYFKRPLPVFRKVLVVVFAVFFCLLASEIIVRLTYNKISNYNIEMCRYSLELKQPLPCSKLPFHHFPNKEGIYYGVNIKTNSLGLRDYEYSIAKPKNKKRIVVIGDSFTLGWGVEFENLFSKRLERLLNEKYNNYEVINMGTGNYNSTMEVELFKLKGLKLDPDMVILAYFVNDVEAVPSAKTNITYCILKYSYFSNFLFDRIVRFKSHFDRDFEWSSYYKRLYSPDNSVNLSANASSITELIQICGERDIKLLIVNIPELRQLKEYQLSAATEHIKSLAMQGNVPFLDMHTFLAEHEPVSLWISTEDPHANAKANSVIANQIFKKIQVDDDCRL